MQKREAIDSLRKYQRLDYDAMMAYRDALKDPSESIRSIAARNISVTAHNRDTVLAMLKAVLESDTVSIVRAAVIEALGKQKAKDYIPLIEKYLGDSSYLVASTSLSTLNKLDSTEALKNVKLFDKETVFDIKNAVYTVVSSSGDSTYDSYFVRKLHEEKGFSRSFLLYHYANFLLRMSSQMVDKGIDNMKSVILAGKGENTPVHGFGAGAIERIKDNYTRAKGVYESILNSDRKTKAKYDLNKIRSEMARMDEVIAHAKAAIEEVKK